MPIDRKNIAKNAIMLFVRTGLISVASLYTSRIVLQQLGASDFGIYNVVGGIVAMIAFINSTLTQGVQRFLNYYLGKSDEEMIKKVFSVSVVVQVLLVFLILILAESVGLWLINKYINIPPERLNAAIWVFEFSVLCLVISILQVPYTALIIAHEKMSIYTYVSIVEAFLKIIVAILISVSSFDKLIFYSILIFITQIIVGTIYFLYSKNKFVNVRFNLCKSKDLYKSMLTFSGWNVLGTSTNIISVQGINIILNVFFGTIVNAARAIAVQIGSLLDSLITNVQVAMNPQLIKSYAEGDLEGMNSLLEDNFKWNFYFFWIIGLPIFIKSEAILNLWLADVPDYTNIFVRFIIIRCLLKCFERPLVTIMFAYGKMKFPNIISSISVGVSCIFAYVLFSNGYEPYWAFVLDIFAIIAIICFDFAWTAKNGLVSIIQFIKNVFIPLLLSILISSLLSILVSSLFGDGLLDVFIFTICSVIISIVIIFCAGMSVNQRRWIVSKCSRFFRDI